jgi:hypothetical protein
MTLTETVDLLNRLSDENPNLIGLHLELDADGSGKLAATHKPTSSTPKSASKVIKAMADHPQDFEVCWKFSNVQELEGMQPDQLEWTVDRSIESYEDEIL